MDERESVCKYYFLNNTLQFVGVYWKGITLLTKNNINKSLLMVHFKEFNGL